MKKVLTLILVLAMLMTLGACKKEEPKEITFWMQSYGDRAAQVEAMDKIVASFHEEHEDIKVNYEIIDWSSAFQKYSLAMQGGESPDIAEFFWLTTFAEMGGEEFGPMEINDVAKDMDAENIYFESSLFETKIGDDFYALPWRMDTRIMIYRKDLFEEAGITNPPTTWDELVTTAKALTTDTVSGVGYYVTRGDFTQAALATLAQNGTSVLDFATEEVLIDSPEAVEAIQFMQDLIYTHEVMKPSIATPTTDSGSKFFSGEVAILMGVNPDFITTLREQAPQLVDKVGYAVLPSKTGQGESSVLFAAPVSIMKTTENPEEAKIFLKHFLSVDSQTELMRATGLINANKEVMQDEIYNDDWYVTLSEQASKAKNGDLPVPYWGDISAFPDGPIADTISRIFNNEDVETLLGEAADKIETIVSSN